MKSESRLAELFGSLTEMASSLAYAADSPKSVAGLARLYAWFSKLILVYLTFMEITFGS